MEIKRFDKLEDFINYNTSKANRMDKRNNGYKSTFVKFNDILKAHTSESGDSKQNQDVSNKDIAGELSKPDIKSTNGANEVDSKSGLPIIKGEILNKQKDPETILFYAKTPNKDEKKLLNTTVNHYQIISLKMTILIRKVMNPLGLMLIIQLTAYQKILKNIIQANL